MNTTVGFAADDCGNVALLPSCLGSGAHPATAATNISASSPCITPLQKIDFTLTSTISSNFQAFRRRAADVLTFGRYDEDRRIIFFDAQCAAPATR
jgi:hypothetical protein